MRHSENPRPGAGKAKKSHRTGGVSETNGHGKVASLLVVGVVAMAAFAFGITRKGTAWVSRPIDSRVAVRHSNQPPTTNTSPAKSAQASASQLMMGGDPRGNFILGSAALSSARPQRASMLMLKEEGQIVLDPVCETIESHTPRLAPGNPAPSTRRMAQRLAEIHEKAHPATMGYLSDRLAQNRRKDD